MSKMYQIENAKLNKKLIGDIVTVSKVKRKYSDGSKESSPKLPTTRQMILETRQILIDFIKEQKVFNNRVESQLKVHGLMLTQLEKDVKNIYGILERNNIS